MRIETTTLVSALALLAMGATVQAQDATEITLDDVSRPVQSQVTEIWEPVPAPVEALEGQAPSDAIILFDGSNLDAWKSAAQAGGPAEWFIEDGVLRINQDAGDIISNEAFCDAQIHLEWKVSDVTEGFEGQDRGNSGIKIQDRYEIQILDSIDNPTYVNGQAGSVYKQHAPLVNASRQPGEWQTYDIIFDAPIFDEGSGALRRPAYVTVLHNGVVVQNHAQIQGTTAWVGYPKYTAHGCEPIRLQDHNADVSYRNIWVRPL